MRRHVLDAEITRLREQIKGMKPRTVEYHAATERLKSYVTERMRRDRNSAARTRKAA